MLIKRLQAVAIAGILGAAVVATPTPALADSNSYCGHGSTSHWHWVTYDSVGFLSQRTFYDGSYLRHTHTYINAYVSFGQGWEDRETKDCPRH